MLAIIKKEVKHRTMTSQMENGTELMHSEVWESRN